MEKIFIDHKAAGTITLSSIEEHLGKMEKDPEKYAMDTLSIQALIDKIKSQATEISAMRVMLMSTYGTIPNIKDSLN